MLGFLGPEATAYAAPAAAGLAAIFSVLTFYLFVNAKAKSVVFKRRMTAVADHRRALRDESRTRSDKKSKRGVELMSGAVDMMKMKEKSEERSLKMRLVSAGFRSQEAPVKFVFAQIVTPFILAAAAISYFHFIVKPEEAAVLHYGLVLFGGFALGYILPGVWLDGRKAARQRELTKAYPDALDLMTICVESGMSVEQSFNRVAAEIGPYAQVMSEELQITTAELSFLGDRRKALENLGERTDLSQVRAVVSALIQAEKYGTPVAQALRVVSAESRSDRMARAETKAAALPAKLTVPMMVFFLPVLFIVILGPSIIEVRELL